MQPQLNEIPSAQWPGLLDQFSRSHHGQRADFAIVAPDSGRHEEGRGLPLLGVTAEPSKDGVEITITLASDEGTHISHEIQHPTRVRLAEWNDGVSADLEIDAADGFSASVRVGPAEQTIPSGTILDEYYPRP